MKEEIKPIHILIVDPDIFYSLCISEYLKSNFQCKISTLNSVEKMYSFAEQSPEVILTNLNYETDGNISKINIFNLKRSFPESKIIVLTESDYKASELIYSNPGADEYLVKNMNELEILSNIIQDSINNKYEN